MFPFITAADRSPLPLLIVYGYNIGLILTYVWILLEVIFYFAIRLVARQLDRLTVPQKYSTNPEKLIKRIANTAIGLSTYSFQHFIEGVFIESVITTTM